MDELKKLMRRRTSLVAKLTILNRRIKMLDKTPRLWRVTLTRCVDRRVFVRAASYEEAVKLAVVHARRYYAHWRSPRHVGGKWTTTLVQEVGKRPS